jgi:hypothetical protein
MEDVETPDFIAEAERVYWWSESSLLPNFTSLEPNQAWLPKQETK